LKEKHQGVLRPEEWGSAHVELVLDTFKHIDETWGSFDNFLTNHVKLNSTWRFRLNESIVRSDFGDDVA
jgi:hypothetical protein